MAREDQPAASHPSYERLRAFALGGVDRAAGKIVALHLLGCRACFEAIIPLTQPLFAPEPVDPAKYDFPIARFCAAFRREMGRQRRERAAKAPPLPSAEALFEELLPSLPPLGERHWRHCERLLGESWKARHTDPEQMVHLAAIASAIAERIDPGTRGPRALADLQARALAAVGNARRVADDPFRAEADLIEALARFHGGTGDPLILGTIWKWLARTYLAQRRFVEARQLFESSLRLYEQQGKSHEAGEVILHLALTEMYAGTPEAAVEHFLSAVSLLDPRLEPKALPFCLHNLAWTWADCGEFELAREVTWRSRVLFAEFPDPLIQVKLLWLDGRIAAGMGHLARAERCFKQARETFLARKLPYDAALVALDLGLLWLRSGRNAETRSLVLEALEVFSLIKLPREAAVAVHLLARAATQDRLTVTILQRAAADLQKVDR